jgi:hypothetical protein
MVEVMFSKSWYIRMSERGHCHILDSDHLPLTFMILDFVRKREVLDPVEMPRLGAVSRLRL